MKRNHLAGTSGDAVNAVVAAAGYNFRLLVLWKPFARLADRDLRGNSSRSIATQNPKSGFFTNDFIEARCTLSSLGVYSSDLRIPLDAFVAGLGDHKIITTLCPGARSVCGV
jgi:predicted acylesterase/phospholipase RssA